MVTMKIPFLTKTLPLEHARVQAAIAAAEARTSGEIRVVVSRRPAADAVAEATRQFTRLGMTRTAERNGVLIFIAPSSRTFAVLGDTAVHARCGDSFWPELAAAMEAAFRQGDFTGGLVLGIERAGELLAVHFPRAGNDRNELPDTVEEV